MTVDTLRGGNLRVSSREDMTRASKPQQNPHNGGTFDDFLREEGIYESVQTTAIKRVLAMQLEDVVKARKLAEAKMTRRMRTSRTN
jgi:hypothetical protein